MTDVIATSENLDAASLATAGAVAFDATVHAVDHARDDPEEMARWTTARAAADAWAADEHLRLRAKATRLHDQWRAADAAARESERRHRKGRWRCRISRLTRFLGR